MADTSSTLPPLPPVADRFPRHGAFVVVGGKLAIIARKGLWRTIDDTEPDPADPTKTRTVRRDAFDTDAPFVELHLVNEDPDHAKFNEFLRPDDAFIKSISESGAEIAVTEHGEIRNVANDQLARAEWTRVRPIIDKRNGEAGPPRELWAHRSGYVLDDAQQATAREQLAAEQVEKRQAHYISQHPEANALEAEIRKEAAAFQASVDQRRSELHSRLIAERGAEK